MDSNALAGTITFLFSDIEGSTRLWEQHPGAMKAALARHDDILRRSVTQHQGQIVKLTGDGCLAVFESASGAVLAALAAQQALQADAWDELKPQVVRARMALHTGEAEARGGDYFGPAVNRAARLMSAGHGGQVLLSAASAELLRDALPVGAGLLDLGEQRLKDLARPEHVFQLLHPTLPSNFPSLRSLDAFPHNLPVQLTSFIGREREMAEVKRLLATTHLLTLTGPGGTGKTRLALQLGAEMLGVADYADGVWLVELAALEHPGALPQAIAAAFCLGSMPGREPLDAVTDFLRDKRLLLILDNCEHLIDAVARLADHLLRASPRLKILASSREALGVTGEVAFRVPSLSLPEEGAHGVGDDASHMSPVELMACEAARLFVERATAVNPRFALTDRNAPAVAQICRRLDGIPLALELAAARVKVFTAEQIAARLDDRFRLLTGGSRTALPRQQTLRAAIDWSYDLLAEPERALLKRLSVFVGGWTFEAAEAICPGEDVLEALTQLVNKSLVVAEHRADEREDGVRYRMLETVRQYARDRLLDAGVAEVAAARDCHLDYFLSVSEQAEPPLRGRRPSTGSCGWNPTSTTSLRLASGARSSAPKTRCAWSATCCACGKWRWTS